MKKKAVVVRVLRNKERFFCWILCFLFVAKSRLDSKLLAQSQFREALSLKELLGSMPEDRCANYSFGKVQKNSKLVLLSERIKDILSGIQNSRADVLASFFHPRLKITESVISKELPRCKSEALLLKRVCSVTAQSI